MIPFIQTALCFPYGRLRKETRHGSEECGCCLSDFAVFGDARRSGCSHFRLSDCIALERLEPQLASIVEELQALRKQGVTAGTSGAAPRSQAASDGLVVYYFHGNIRCPTCQSIEMQASKAVQSNFAAELNSGKMTWKIVNYDQTAARSLATQFEIDKPVVVLARMKGGQVQEWRSLGKVWALESDKPAFEKYIRDEIKQMLPSEKEPPGATPKTDAPLTPIPKTDVPESAAPRRMPEVPIPIPEK